MINGDIQAKNLFDRKLNFEGISEHHRFRPD